MRIWLALAIAACSSTPAKKPPVTQRFSNQLDLLFVIDDGHSMGDKTTVFAANFPKLVQAFDAFPGGRPSLHIGVVTSTVDIGSTSFSVACPSPNPAYDGLLQNTARVTGCSPPVGRFIVDDGATENFSGTLDAAFSCIAQVSGLGCPFKAPLEGMKRALDGSRPENDGFLRDDANLGVFFITDDDDCSAADSSLFDLPASQVGGVLRCDALGYECDQPISISEAGTYGGCTPKLGSYLTDPASYVDFLHAVRPEQRIAIGMISGDAPEGLDGKWTFATRAVTDPFGSELDPAPSCTATINGNATIGTAGIRLSSFLTHLTADEQWSTICQSDYSTALTAYGALLEHIMKPCLAFAIDATDRDASNPGIQPACTVTADGAEIPLCAMRDETTPISAAGCVYFTADDSCGTPANLAVHAGTYSSLAVTCTAAP